MKYKNLIVVAALGVVFAVVAIAQERTPPMSSTPSAMGTTTPSVLKLETITPSATPPMAGTPPMGGTPPMARTPPMSGKPARRRRTPCTIKYPCGAGSICFSCRQWSDPSKLKIHEKKGLP